MNIEEVREYIGDENENAFLKFMRGKTVGLNPDGTTDFYECDVDLFHSKLETMLESPEDYKDDFLKDQIR